MQFTMRLLPSADLHEPDNIPLNMNTFGELDSKAASLFLRHSQLGSSLFTLWEIGLPRI